MGLSMTRTCRPTQRGGRRETRAGLPPGHTLGRRHMKPTPTFWKLQPGAESAFCVEAAILAHPHQRATASHGCRGREAAKRAYGEPAKISARQRCATPRRAPVSTLDLRMSGRPVPPDSDVSQATACQWRATILLNLPK